MFVLDTFGALYETQTKKEFPPFCVNLKKDDDLCFEMNGKLHYTYDVLDVTAVYD